MTKYLVITNPLLNPMLYNANTHVEAQKLANKSHKTFNAPSYIFTLLETIGEKRYHYVIKNNDGLIILDSRTQKSFDGYETEVGAKYVAQHAAKDINLEPGYSIEIV